MCPLRGAVFDWERLNPTGYPGDAHLGKVSGRYFPLNTGLKPARLFNPRVAEQHAGEARAGANVNTCR
jgi:hypothetical protein